MADEFAHVGDIGVKFEFTFFEKDGVTPVDLTGGTVTMKVEKRGGAGTTRAASGGTINSGASIASHE